jgi:DNA-binding winged helix-turn-helix (wHTH) protein/tetratricopeptide (TPR) repeat protein
VPSPRHIHFAPFALDLVNECLWKGPEAIKLRPKTFAVLEHLVSKPGELVTKHDLIAAVWPDTFVGDAVLKVAIRQIREALSDNPKLPRFIETAHRRGYRFIAEINPIATVVTEDSQPQPRMTPTRSNVQGRPEALHYENAFVGRDDALSLMHEWFDKARDGECQVVFVTGEAGIGKTTLLEAFARRIAADRRVRICSGQCLEQYGMSEAYLPVLDALTQLCRKDPLVVGVLRAFAPMWLMQMPSLVTASDRESFGREAAGATRDRMLREICEALETLAAHEPLVLVLEDLHWSDFSTLDLISYAARRRRAAHLMIVGTYRPAELIASRHPLRTVKQELVARQQCEELPLEYLSEEAIAEHLAVKFPRNQFPSELVTLIHERTEGNPLFMVNTIDHLIAERLIESHEDGWRLTAPIDTVKLGVPDSIRQLIETQIDRLDPTDQRILEAASVAGAEFPSAAVSAALADDVTDVELRCEELSRRHQFIKEGGAQVLPNGEAVGRFGFVHAVYRHVLYERMSSSRRMQLHRRIGLRGEELYGDRTSEIAAELAMHFEQAADSARAVRYLHQAAVNALHRSAYREAIVVSRRGLELLAALPDTDERAHQELRLQLTLGVPLIATEGYAAPEVGRLYQNARELCERLEATAEMSQALWGVWTFHTLRAELSTALGIAREFLWLADRLGHPDLLMRGHWAMEITCTHQGDFGPALEHYVRALALYDDGERHHPNVDPLNPGVAMRSFAAWCAWFVGQPDRGLTLIQEAVGIARELSEPHGLAHALASAALVHQLRGERRLAEQHADAIIALSDEHGLVLYQAMARVVRAWSQIGRGDDEAAAEEIRQGMAAWRSTGADLMCPHFLALLTEALPPAPDGQALRVLDEALTLVESTGERCYEAELHRLKGERLLERAQDGAGVDAAEACFEQAIAIARRQQAHSLELRAAISLAHLQHDHRKTDMARDLIAQIYERFDQGFDTLDLRQARTLLASH